LLNRLIGVNLARLSAAEREYDQADAEQEPLEARVHERAWFRF
jgi:hypothetical protein